jgi:hypothetical protein
MMLMHLAHVLVPPTSFDYIEGEHVLKNVQLKGR